MFGLLITRRSPQLLRTQKKRRRRVADERGVINKPAPPSPEAKQSQHLAEPLSDGRNGFQIPIRDRRRQLRAGTRVLRSVKGSARHDVESI